MTHKQETDRSFALYALRVFLCLWAFVFGLWFVNRDWLENAGLFYRSMVFGIPVATILYLSVKKDVSIAWVAIAAIGMLGICVFVESVFLNSFKGAGDGGANIGVGIFVLSLPVLLAIFSAVIVVMIASFKR